MSTSYADSSTLEPTSSVRMCPVCGGADTIAWKKGDLTRDLQPEDLHITDSRYGITLELFRCRECGFIHARDEEINRLTSLYERMEDQHYDDTAPGRMLQMEWIVKLIRHHAPAPRTLLDIGAGTGMLVSVAQRQGLEACGVEPSCALAALARSRDLPVWQGLHPHPSLKNQCFDVVCLVDVIEHVEDPNRLLRDAAASLSPGGLLVVVTPDIGSMAARLLGKRWWHLRLAHVGYFNAGSFRHLARRCGLQIVATKRAKWFFPASYLAERVEAYLPWTRGCHRWFRSIPLLKRVYGLVIPVNLHDSHLFLLRKAQP